MFKAVAEELRQLRRKAPKVFLAGGHLRVPSVNDALASGIGALLAAVGVAPRIS
ncbi:MAG: hypothetical protein OXH99_10045 [Bryobacterales bacterium]|nr:hypothetical protein [Bryobacterales bacterium]